METCLKRACIRPYGTTGSLPSGTPLIYATVYDTALQTYPISTDPPLLPATTMTYYYGRGLPATITDPNGNTTTTDYDGLGRVISVKYQGYAQANVKYTYPTPTGSPLAVSAPFAIKLEVGDETASVYRSAWQMADGLGRTIQTQSPYETAGTLVLNDTFYDARGLVFYSSLSRTLSGTGGTYFAPNWASIPHTTTQHDEISRLIWVTYADGAVEMLSYSGLRTTSIDRNSHQKVQESDVFGRLIKVEEYIGSNPYTLYAATNYTYDERDLLKTVTDATGNVTTINYDGFGRKIEMTDPDMGNWRYRYDTLGRLTAQIDAKRQATLRTQRDNCRCT